jgi:hypothetical protein
MAYHGFVVQRTLHDTCDSATGEYDLCHRPYEGEIALMGTPKYWHSSGKVGSLHGVLLGKNGVFWRTSYDLTPPVNPDAIILGHYRSAQGGLRERKKMWYAVCHGDGQRLRCLQAPAL